jgi:hypothetical protein
LAGREVSTATSRRNALSAARYLGRYARLAPLNAGNVGHGLVQLGRIMALLALPVPIANASLARVTDLGKHRGAGP